MNIESIWEDATKTVIPREGDFSCVSHKNILEFARLLIERFYVEMCIIREDCDDTEFNGLVNAAKAELFHKE